MQVRLLAFARVRELLGTDSQRVELPDGSTAADLWKLLCTQTPGLEALAESTRIARNGHVMRDRDEMLHEGDEVALLPPAGGG